MGRAEEAGSRKRGAGGKELTQKHSYFPNSALSTQHSFTGGP